MNLFMQPRVQQLDIVFETLRIVVKRSIYKFQSSWQTFLFLGERKECLRNKAAKKLTRFFRVTQACETGKERGNEVREFILKS